MLQLGARAPPWGRAGAEPSCSPHPAYRLMRRLAALRRSMESTSSLPYISAWQGVCAASCRISETYARRRAGPAAEDACHLRSTSSPSCELDGDSSHGARRGGRRSPFPSTSSDDRVQPLAAAGALRGARRAIVSVGYVSLRDFPESHDDLGADPRSLSGAVFMQVALYFQLYSTDRWRIKTLVSVEVQA